MGNTGNITCKLTAASSLAALKIEYGPNATPYQPRPHAEERDLCMRYFERILGTTGGGNWYEGAYFITANNVHATFTFTTVKRVKPSSSVSGLDVFSNAVAQQTGFSFVVSDSSDNAIRVTATKTAHGLTAGSVIRLSTGGIIDVDSEL